MMCQLPLDKASGPNGLTGRFYTCWTIMKTDIIAAILVVLSRKFVNSAYITLIPKNNEAMHVKDF